MNPTKIVGAWVTRVGSFNLLDDEGYVHTHACGGADKHLARFGQRAVWPEGHGVAVIEDIPRPEPLPTIYLKRDSTGELWASLVQTCTRMNLLATVTFDEDGNATVTRVTP